MRAHCNIARCTNSRIILGLSSLHYRQSTEGHAHSCVVACASHTAVWWHLTSGGKLPVKWSGTLVGAEGWLLMCLSSSISCCSGAERVESCSHIKSHFIACSSWTIIRLRSGGRGGWCLRRGGGGGGGVEMARTPTSTCMCCMWREVGGGRSLMLPLPWLVGRPRPAGRWAPCLQVPGCGGKGMAIQCNIVPPSPPLRGDSFRQREMYVCV